MPPGPGLRCWVRNEITVFKELIPVRRAAASPRFLRPCRGRVKYVGANRGRWLALSFGGWGTVSFQLWNIEEKPRGGDQSVTQRAHTHKLNYSLGAVSSPEVGLMSSSRPTPPTGLLGSGAVRTRGLSRYTFRHEVNSL